MYKPKDTIVPRLPEELLRPFFWQVSGDRSSRAYATPFQRHRLIEGLSPDVVAARMGMPADIYTAMEQGVARPSSMLILSFCQALGLHPLDLYPEPYNGVCLAHEIRDALIILAVTPSCDLPDRVRARQRLEEEQARADVLLKTRIKSLAPLMCAMGFSRDMKVFYAPLHNIHADDDDDFKEILDGGEDSPRGVINAYLNAHQVFLEREYEHHNNNLEWLIARQARIQKNMNTLGTFIYGDQYQNSMVKSLRKILDTSETYIKARDWFIANPGAIGKVQNTQPRNLRFGGDSGTDQLIDLNRALILFVYMVRLDYDLDGHIQRQSGMALSSFEYQREFTEWRDRPHTQRMIDWFENWLVLGDFFNGNQTPARYLVHERLPKLARG